ncbi:helix-turn-helix domain-containing protein [Clostridium tetani]|uniref:Excisionase n=1 Tax=Clostridium tetani TaxID=1513 RepID=A0ABY0ERX3_CLOTA|nr:helix-turn-helix domain-containing protein [Clostridium tetani]RXI58090.1 excisionase [Clostridium tetani]RXI66007.1 excisionase [Clostridium tetani]
MKDKIIEETKNISNDELKNIIKEAIREVLYLRNEKVTLTIDECVNYSGIGRNKLMELAHADNDFPAFKIGKRFLIHKEMLDEWLGKIVQEKTTL